MRKKRRLLDQGRNLPAAFAATGLRTSPSLGPYRASFSAPWAAQAMKYIDQMAAHIHHKSLGAGDYSAQMQIIDQLLQAIEDCTWRS